MKFYLAPLEGITGYIYRSAYQKYFHNVDKYFTPFITPHVNRCLNSKEQNDILPEHNQGMKVVPQILTNCANDFVNIARTLKEYGYDEVNLNLGCPSGTVVSKKRGSGFLAYPIQLNDFLEEAFARLDMKISIKTRIGKDDPEEWEELLKLYNKYPMEELIIHPRIQTDFYKNTPNWQAYGHAVKESKNPLCYNGDIFAVADYEKLLQEFPNTDTVMLGRGAIANPQLIDMIRTGDTKADREKIKAFHDEVCSGYEAVLSGDRNVLFKMKELWFYMGQLFEDSEKYMKKIKKSQSLAEYRMAVNIMFWECL